MSKLSESQIQMLQRIQRGDPLMHSKGWARTYRSLRDAGFVTFDPVAAERARQAGGRARDVLTDAGKEALLRARSTTVTPR
jgi:hypothetical protein